MSTLLSSLWISPPSSWCTSSKSASATLSRPLATPSRFRLEFVVLNQLISVAARGLKRETFEEKRYHHTFQPDAFSAKLRQWGICNASTGQKIESQMYNGCQEGCLVETTLPRTLCRYRMPSPAYAREHHPSFSAVSEHASGKRLTPYPPPLEDDVSEEGSPAPPESPVVRT